MSNHVDLDHFLANNIALTPAERVKMKAILAESYSYAGHLASRITTLRMELERTHREHRRVSANIHKATLVLAPARALPAEILSEIFFWVAMDGEPQRRHRPRGPPPWRLGLVCRYWRNIALALPVLWSRFSVGGHETRARPPSDRQQHAFVAQAEQLARSGRSPLFVSFTWSKDSVDTTISLMGMLMEHSGRWKEFAFYAIHDVDTFFAFLRPISGRLSTVENLRCSCYHPLNSPVDLFSDVPRLAELDFMVERNDIEMPWHRVTKCYMEGLLEEHLPSLELAHNLVELFLNVQPPDFLDPEPDTITLPRLRTLFVLETVVLRFFTTPELQRLHLTSGDLDLAAEFFKRSQCQLDILALSEEERREEGMIISEFVDLLRYMPRLKVLIITGQTRLSEHPEGNRSYDHDLNSLFTAMKIDGPESSALVPQLSTFFFGLDQNVFMDQTFQTMICSRRGPLTRVVVEMTSKEYFSVGDWEGADPTIEWMEYSEIQDVQYSYFYR
ncbi:F-box domain-containing protein [Mycena indigotica]|uniref:F-box domain-containing protein n=1 Tax=Mycena indigotica TaxID=2126181 RepID=A0A8H6VT76_9AGAR|nr:F-box domain-containing protein [Mycena indigotica]KAF7293039.1 F-box domain-containing protein [Mycena indigotica]